MKVLVECKDAYLVREADDTCFHVDFGGGDCTHRCHRGSNGNIIRCMYDTPENRARLKLKGLVECAVGE